MNLTEEIVVGIPVRNPDIEHEIFPSKIGGLPKWLALEGYPKPICSSCGKPLKFLMQLYAPLEDIEDAYYRSIYLFICNESGCKNKEHSIKVFRNQLSKFTEYYVENEEGIHENGKNPGLPAEHLLTKKVYDLETVVVETEDTQKVIESLANLDKGVEMEDDDDDEDDGSKTSEDYRHENELIKKYLEEEKNEEFKTMGGDFNDIAKDLDEAQKDKNFNKFVRICESYPNQVLRYCRHSSTEPLWISDTKVPDISKIPKCAKCGGKRIFEFQINCQILHYVSELTLLDWGILAVYTCEASCFKTENDYIDEHVVLQLNAQEVCLDEKALKQIMEEASKTGGTDAGLTTIPEKKKKKRNRKKKQPTKEEGKGTDSEDDDEDGEGEGEGEKKNEGEGADSESDWM